MTLRLSTLMAFFCLLAFAKGDFGHLEGKKTPAALNHTTSWLGNTFSAAVEARHVPSFIEGAYVTPDGTVYTNVIAYRALATRAGREHVEDY